MGLGAGARGAWAAQTRYEHAWLHSFFPSFEPRIPTLFACEDAPELVHFFQRLARAAHDAGERIVGDDHRQPGFFHEEAIEVAQERPAPGEHHAFFGDVGAELGRSLLQRRLHRADDLVERFSERFQDLVRGNGEASRDALREVAALHFHLAHFGAGEGRADFLLDRFRRGLTDEHAVIAADVVDDGLVELVPADAHRARIDHAAERYDADFRRPAADVHHHRARGFGYRQVRADPPGPPPPDQANPAPTRPPCCFAEPPPPHPRRAARRAHADARRRLVHARPGR